MSEGKKKFGMQLGHFQKSLGSLPASECASPMNGSFTGSSDGGGGGGRLFFDDGSDDGVGVDGRGSGQQIRLGKGFNAPPAAMEIGGGQVQQQTTSSSSNRQPLTFVGIDEGDSPYSSSQLQQEQRSSTEMNGEPQLSSLSEQRQIDQQQQKNRSKQRGELGTTNVQRGGEEQDAMMDFSVRTDLALPHHKTNDGTSCVELSSSQQQDFTLSGSDRAKKAPVVDGRLNHRGTVGFKSPDAPAPAAEDTPTLLRSGDSSNNNISMMDGTYCGSPRRTESGGDSDDDDSESGARPRFTGVTGLPKMMAPLTQSLGPDEFRNAGVDGGDLSVKSDGNDEEEKTASSPTVSRSGHLLGDNSNNGSQREGASSGAARSSRHQHGSGSGHHHGGGSHQSRYQISEIIPNFLFLSGSRAANSASRTMRYGISAYLNVAAGEKLPTANYSQSDIDKGLVIFKHVPMVDNGKTVLQSYFDECFSFLHQCLDEGRKVLVYCREGKSRSASIVIAYLIRYHDMDYDSALEMLRQVREQVDPNMSFCSQLDSFSQSLQGDQFLIGSPSMNSSPRGSAHSLKVIGSVSSGSNAGSGSSAQVTAPGTVVTMVMPPALGQGHASYPVPTAANAGGGGTDLQSPLTVEVDDLLTASTGHTPHSNKSKVSSTSTNADSNNSTTSYIHYPGMSTDSFAMLMSPETLSGYAHGSTVAGGAGGRGGAARRIRMERATASSHSGESPGLWPQPHHEPPSFNPLDHNPMEGSVSDEEQGPTKGRSTTRHPGGHIVNTRQYQTIENAPSESQLTDSHLTEEALREYQLGVGDADEGRLTPIEEPSSPKRVRLEGSPNSGGHGARETTELRTSSDGGHPHSRSYSPPPPMRTHTVQHLAAFSAVVGEQPVAHSPMNLTKTYHSPRAPSPDSNGYLKINE